MAMSTSTGGAPGSGTGDILESIAITNTGASPLSLHFFQYVDLDLYASLINSSVRITGGNTATQELVVPRSIPIMRSLAMLPNRFLA